MSVNARLLELEQELAKRELSNQSPEIIPQGITVSPNDNVDRVSELEQELDKRSRKEAEDIVGGELEPKEWQKFLKGFTATGPAGIVDLLDLVRSGHEPNESQLQNAPEYLKPIVKFLGSQSRKNEVPLSQIASEKFHETTGFPKPQVEEGPGISEITGQLLIPNPAEIAGLAGKGLNIVQKGIKAIPELLKKTGTRLAESYGAATGMKELPNITEEGSLPETLAKAVIGSTAAKGILNVPKLIPTQKNIARAVSLGTKPNEELFNLVEKQGVEVPINVGMESRPLNLATNYLSKTMFSSQKFRDSIKRADKSMLKSAEDKMNTLGTENVVPSEASQKFKDFLIKQEKEVNQLVSKEYDNARALLKPADSVIPMHTIKTIESMKDILESPVKDKSTKAVAKVVLDLADAWHMTPKDLSKQIRTGNGEKLLEHPEAISRILQQIGKSSHHNVPLTQLDMVRSQIGKILGHKQEVYGMEKWLKGLQSSIAKDLENSSNKEYVSSLRKAHDLYRESYASRFREDLAESIMTGKEPLYTYNQLNDTHTLKTLEKIAGESSEAKELVNSLKKAKVREIFNKAYTQEGVNTGNFSRIFDKNEVSQEFLKELFGPEAYKGMSDLASIMKEQQAAGREVLNTSGTAYTQSDLKTLGKFGSAVAGAITALFATNPGVGVAGLGAAVTTVGATNYLSRLMANPAFVKQARAFAIARKNNNIKFSDQLLNQMGKTANTILKAESYNQQKEEDNE
jgi:hypothetical protein